MKQYFILFCLLILLGSCARKYHEINPSSYNFENRKELKDSVLIYYRYDVQQQERNKPYVRKEDKKGYRLIAIQIVNNSESDLTIEPHNLVVKTSAGRIIPVVDQLVYTQEIRQSTEQFIAFYGLAGIGVQWRSFNGETEMNLFYNPIPLFIGIGNAIYAGSSNNKQRRNLMAKSIFHKNIKSGSRLYGLLAIQEDGYPELFFELQ